MTRAAAPEPIVQAPARTSVRAGPILLTGAHRSGTTWVGKILSAAPGVGLIYEPFNRRWRRAGVCAVPWKFWYEYICEENESGALPAVRSMLAFRYNVGEELKSIRSVRDAARMARDATRFGRARMMRARPIVKDPIALFSAPWLADRFGMQVIVLVRHPAAFANSLRRRGWVFDFNNLLGQERLMEARLAPFRAEIEAFVERPHDIIEQAGLLWKVLYATVDAYRSERPEWTYVRHEDLSADPQRRFREVFDAMGLEFSDRVERRLAALTTGVREERPEDAVHWMRRDSASVAHEWRAEMSDEDLERLRARVGGVYERFYSEEDWGA